MSYALRLAAVAWLAAAPAAAQAPRRLALLVGVQKYTGELTSLRYAERDVTELARLLREGKYDHVVLMTDTEAFARANEDLFPTAANVRRQLDAIAKLAADGDTLLVAFTGHGVHLQQPAGSYFCPKGADIAKPETLVALTEAYDALKASKAADRVLLVDACRNDPLASKSKVVNNLASVTRPEVPKPPRGVAALLSCSVGERSFEDEASQHGFFLKAVLDGLSGKAAADGGDVNLFALANYVSREVPVAVQAALKNPDARQTPELFKFEGQPPVLLKALAAPELTNGVGMRLVRVREGVGVVGPKESPRPIRVAAPFYLSATTVTQAQYKAVTKATPSWFAATGGGRDAVVGLETDDFPVENVTWAEAKAFCAALSKLEPKRRYRLPTGDEWEYAARAGSTTAYPWGDDAKALEKHGWYDGNAEERPHPVGKKAPNKWGLSDMHGNVWQWTADEALGGRRAVRGGAFDQIAKACRSAEVQARTPGERASNVGFRVACEIGDR